jgi:hypothetical protein
VHAAEVESERVKDGQERVLMHGTLGYKPAPADLVTFINYNHNLECGYQMIIFRCEAFESFVEAIALMLLCYQYRVKLQQTCSPSFYVSFTLN